MPAQDIFAAGHSGYDPTSDEDAESDYKSCRSYEDEDVDAESDHGSCRSYEDGDVDGTEEDCSDEDNEAIRLDEDIEILQSIENGDDSYEWVPIAPSDVKYLFGTEIGLDKGWVSKSVHEQWMDALPDVRERILDALAALSDTIGGLARRHWHQLLSYEKTHGVVSMVNYYDDLQALLLVIICSTRAWTDTDWLGFDSFYICSQNVYHLSFTSSLFEERMFLDYSLDRPWKDLADVMQITLPYFREMTARVETLSKLHCVGSSSGSSDSTLTLGPTTTANLITCLDVAESVAKLVPVFGAVLEGTCGILRKVIQAAEGARAARDECKALAEHTACITLAIVNEIGSRSTGGGAEIKKISDLSVTIGEVNQRIRKLSKLGKLEYFTKRTKIRDQVQDLRVQLDNARISFQIGNDITTTRLLSDLTMMQARLMSRVDDIHQVQMRMDGKLDMILVKMRLGGSDDSSQARLVEVNSAD